MFRNYRKNSYDFNQWNFRNFHITFYESVVIKSKQTEFVLDFSFAQSIFFNATMKKAKTRFLFLCIFILSVLILFNLYTSFAFRSEASHENRNTNNKEIENPYRHRTNLKWVKSSFHNHTNEVWYTPGRNSVEEIEKVYSKNGYRILSFSDYGRITRPKDKNLSTIPAFEWGTNLRKRHILVLGGKQPEFDPFPLYADVSNIQWAIDRFHEQGAFVTINHPKLNHSFSQSMLLGLKDYDSIEVFSPFGDEISTWDEILSEDKFPHCMASDDLHYLPRDEYENVRKKDRFTLRDMVALLYRPEGQSLMRYVLLNVNTLESNDILKSLKSGNYVCVRKHDRILEDPELIEIGLTQRDEIFFEFGEKAIRVEFIGKQGRVLNEVHDVKKGNYKFPSNEPYIRLQILFPSALVLSNPFHRGELRKR
ncbi:phosphoesterase [Leptospira barantonii]|uniref:Phosphoesterase n=1 Tax=Leptospira barantonii TaxID=2023184 RepID=A0ABX4NR25_9LEPT|nr:phosphoesterase [Leptospira barantonii]